MATTKIRVQYKDVPASVETHDNYTLRIGATSRSVEYNFPGSVESNLAEINRCILDNVGDGVRFEIWEEEVG
jgi:hypothetical protein